MKAVILVGGEGTRLRPLTFNTNKTMVPVLNKPFLAYVLSYLKSYGIDDVLLALCYLPERITSCFGNGERYELKLNYVVEEYPLGTAGAVKNSEKYLNEPFLVLNGDVYTDLDLSAMMRFHRESGAKVTIALTPVENPTIYGVVETDGQGQVRRFLEKPSWEQVTTNMINAGIYILEPEVLQYIPSQSHFMFESQLFPLLLERGEPIYSYPNYGYWIDIGTPQKYLKLNHDLLCIKQGLNIEEKPHLIHPTAQINEPVLIGSDCHIGPDVLIQGPTVIGEKCNIEQGVEIQGSLLWHNVQIGRGAKLRNCIIASRCYIGAESNIGDGSVLSYVENQY
jgi:mannose-1-phosphate guanylyltransferase